MAQLLRSISFKIFGVAVGLWLVDVHHQRRS
jgi:hypothetical protein